MTVLQQRLFELQDVKYAEFHSKLMPTIDRNTIIGVRAPKVRALAKEFAGTPEREAFMRELPHTCYDENLLHGLFISQIKDYDKCVEELKRFLPYVDNWAVCDLMSPKVLAKDKARTLQLIREWAQSPETYTCRFGIEMLQTFFLDKDFEASYLEIPAGVSLEDYYVKMMQAWFFATALAKQWEAVVPYITENRLEKWVHNKTIQKAVESYRITDEQKTYLRGFKRK